MPTALVTGGTSGIGRATAELLAERGHDVLVTGSSDRSVEAVRPELPAGVEAVRADSRSMADTERLAEEVGRRFGTLDLLFLNAGVVRPAPLEEVDEALYDELFAVNTKGAFFTLQRTAPLLADGASVVFTVGAGGAMPGASVIAGSRGALRSMVPALALELAPRRIRVNAVSPGAVETPIWSRSGLPAEALEANAARMAAQIPLGRLGEAREIAEVVAFLASDGAAYLTGQDIRVAGGLALVS
jgi:NAD(P)-dependent dehydrogenase (short-subunit alcohol dehydrogenase family)